MLIRWVNCLGAKATDAWTELTAKAFVAAVCALGVLLLLAALPLVPTAEWQGLVMFAALSGIAQTVPIHISKTTAVSVSAAFTFAGLILYGPAAAVVINLGSALAAALRPRRKPLHKVLFNLANHVIAASAAGAAYSEVGGTVAPQQPLGSIIPTATAGAVYFVVQTTLLAVAIAITERRTFIDTWRANYLWSVFNFISLAIIGLAIASAKQALGLAGMVVSFIPLGTIWYWFRQYTLASHEVRLQNEVLKLTNEKLEGNYFDAIKTLAAVVDTRDHYGPDHSATAMQYAVAVSRALGLSDQEIAAIQLAALLHDIGKVSIPEAVLSKPGRLTEREWEIVKQHPITGAKLIQGIRSLAPVVPAVLHHHERFDGKGYPNGLIGENIPIGAQIVAVIDAFLAMTTNRPYRKSLGQRLALGELRRCAGTQFNPRIVDAFVTVFEQQATSASKMSNSAPLLRARELPVPVEPGWHRL